MTAYVKVLDLVTLGKLDRQTLRASGAGRLIPIVPGGWRVRQRIPGLPPILPLPPRRPRRKADRYLRFVIETKEPITTEDEILDPVRNVMNANQLDQNAVANNLQVEPLFPGADSSDKITKLAHYYLLIIPISFQRALLMAKKRYGTFWDLAYQLREADPNFVFVDPDLPSEFYMRPLQERVSGCTVGPKEAPLSVDWARHLVRLDQIPAPVPTGQGVRIGHIDTGHTNHSELNRQQRYDLNQDKDLISGDDDATDPMPSGSSHGTMTASVITSLHGTTWNNVNDAVRDGLNGVAPECTIVAVRAIEEVMIIFNTDIAQAIWHCIRSNVHVITMSLGGLTQPWLQSVIAHAVYRQNIIACAAAGNCWPWVVFPAAYPEVIACGGVGIDPITGSPRIWAGSVQGKAVAISAPAENVYAANFDVMGREEINCFEGTSFASPHVAGVAALWLEKHGREKLLNHYAGTKANLCEVFRHIIQTTAQKGPGWDTDKNGAGIIDAAAVLAAPLPAANLFNKSLDQFLHMTEEEIAYTIFDFNQRTMDMIERIIENSRMTLNDFMKEFGREFNQLVGRSEEAWEDFTNGLEAMASSAQDAVQETKDAVEDFVEDVGDTVSDTFSTVAGWLGF